MRETQFTKKNHQRPRSHTYQGARREGTSFFGRAIREPSRAYLAPPYDNYENRRDDDDEGQPLKI